MADASENGKDFPREWVDVQNTEDVNYWCAQLGISPLRLITVIRAVGPYLKDIRPYLAEHP